MAGALQNHILPLENFSVEGWAHLIDDVTQNKGMYIYRICTPSRSGLGISFKVMTPLAYEKAYKSIPQIVSQALASFPAVPSPDFTKICFLGTKKLTLHEVISLTECVLGNRKVYETAFEKLNSLFSRALIEPTPDINISQILNTSLDPYEKLLESFSAFHFKKILPHREGYWGYLREVISLISNIFNRFLKDGLEGIQFVKSNQESCLSLLKYVEDSKKEMARSYLEGLKNTIKQESALSMAALPPLGTPVRSSDHPVESATPLTTLVNNNVLHPDEAEACRVLRAALEAYIQKK